MFRAVGILMTSLLVASCGNPAAQMDASLTSEYCAILTTSQFKAFERNASSIFLGTMGGMKIKAYYKNPSDNVEMPKRGVLRLPSGTRIRIGDGENAIFARAKKDTLIARGEGGPICGPVS